MHGAETRYVAVGDADVAYQAIGEGPFDLLYSYGMGSHIELAWESPAYAEFYNRLAPVSRLSRLIMLDRRGSGASDGFPRAAIPTWEEWTVEGDPVPDPVFTLRVRGGLQGRFTAPVSAQLPIR